MIAITIDQQLIIWLHMYACFCCVTNKLSESLSPKFDVCTMSDNEGYNDV